MTGRDVISRRCCLPSLTRGPCACTSPAPSRAAPAKSKIMGSVVRGGVAVLPPVPFHPSPFDGVEGTSGKTATPPRYHRASGFDMSGPAATRWGSLLVVAQTCKNFHPALRSSRAVYSLRTPARSPRWPALVSESASECASSEENMSYLKMVCLGCALFAAMAILLRRKP